ncbi:hypothetical protein OIV83_002818 [Microbotryomycetes sp. JL201]|nr:hypothetical protein OIV83_002818 [Microbotryomycetes sp. JL201]
MSSARTRPVLYLIVVVVSVALLHGVATFHSPSYADRTSWSTVSARIGLGSDGSPLSWLGRTPGNKTSTSASSVPVAAHNVTGDRANAAFVILARNSDVWEIISSIRGVEDRFNHKFHYPYVFLNDEPFSEEFKKHTSAIASGLCQYGQVPAEHWSNHGDWIDEERAAKARQAMADKNVIYGDSVSYREMCRFQSGFFWRHELLSTYEFYWRIEPSVSLYCDIDYDPFLFMQSHKKKYGFIISIYEYADTTETLWDTTKEFIKQHPDYLAADNLQEFVSDDQGRTYNRCHFWSNFEIGSLEFLRSKAYREYFEHLDHAGGFFYERWGDAPVHSIAASLFLNKSEIHWFGRPGRDAGNGVGYRHNPFSHCPKNSADQCACNPADSFEDHWYSCTKKYKRIMGEE